MSTHKTFIESYGQNLIKLFLENNMAKCKECGGQQCKETFCNRETRYSNWKG